MSKAKADVSQKASDAREAAQPGIDKAKDVADQTSKKASDLKSDASRKAQELKSKAEESSRPAIDSVHKSKDQAVQKAKVPYYIFAYLYCHMNSTFNRQTEWLCQYPILMDWPEASGAEERLSKARQKSPGLLTHGHSLKCCFWLCMISLDLLNVLTTEVVNIACFGRNSSTLYTNRQGVRGDKVSNPWAQCSCACTNVICLCFLLV